VVFLGCLLRIPPVRRNKPGSDGIVIAGVEEDEAGFGIVAFANVTLAFSVRAGRHTLVAIGPVSGATNLVASAVRDDANALEVITVVEVHARSRTVADALDVRREILGPDTGR